ncbi:hypothetical protein [Fimbriimonas ginsengisoli]|uniref:Uncharacterized protein n=1 Tax=Fimbriimonas ginsengisoli Gsoil 348 TaxID=661478 RepID=A0A068NSZ2_FIMGI|nr:hypothetical protein [Fimbriimonas ginsengisoli]AIE86467.1 hypothetical protein OP10G_3099 [Fimbriimonas ginsengisoli Gsoil 348]
MTPDCIPYTIVLSSREALDALRQTSPEIFESEHYVTERRNLDGAVGDILVQGFVPAVGAVSSLFAIGSAIASIRLANRQLKAHALKVRNAEVKDLQGSDLRERLEILCRNDAEK